MKVSSLESDPELGLSLVIACYNDGEIIEYSIRRLREVLEFSGYPYEIVFVDDGSTDGTTRRLEALTADRPNERLIVHSQNQGRGASLRDGIRAARCRIVGCIDIDLETDAHYILPLIMAVENGADISSAFRIYKLTFRSIHRQILSKGYIWLVRHLLRISLRDTETGCKFFQREKILPVLDEIKDRHWFWDTEVMVRSYLRGYRIEEIPTLYVRKPETGTTVKLFRDSYRYLKNLIRFRKEIRQNGSQCKLHVK